MSCARSKSMDTSGDQHPHLNLQMGDICDKLTCRLHHCIFYVEMEGEDIPEAIIQIVSEHKCKGRKGLIITASRPYQTLLEILENIDKETIHIIDCSQESPQGNPEKGVHTLAGPRSLTEIPITASSIIKAIGPNPYVIIDSIPTFLMYNEPEIFLRFIHTFLIKMRQMGCEGILFSSPHSCPDEIRAGISQLCDKVISFS